MKKRIAKITTFVLCTLILFISCNGELNVKNTGFTVSFYNNGKQIGASQTVQPGQTITEPKVPEKPADDMYFVGWFNENTQWDFSKGVKENMILEAKFDPVALKFDSDSSFKITPAFANGVNLEYSVDHGSTWLTCTDAVAISVSDEIFIRGTGNTVITGDIANPKYWAIVSDNGKDGIRCTGNIETLLDYKTVIEGNHPSMGFACFFGLFSDCTHLVSAPELPSTELTAFCYALMFNNCTNLRRIPTLPQVDSYALSCYMGMYSSCSMLHFYSWKDESSEPFFIAGDNVAAASTYMLNGDTPSDNTAYYYIAY